MKFASYDISFSQTYQICRMFQVFRGECELIYCNHFDIIFDKTHWQFHISKCLMRMEIEKKLLYKC